MWDDDSYYLFNFDTDLMHTCSSQHATVIQVFRSSQGNYDECEVAGRSQEISLLDQHRPHYGVKVTYSQGGLCQSYGKSSQRTVTFKVHCNAGVEAETDFTLAKSYTSQTCHTYFSILSPAGCPTDYNIESKSYWLLG